MYIFKVDANAPTLRAQSNNNNKHLVDGVTFLNAPGHYRRYTSFERAKNA